MNYELYTDYKWYFFLFCLLLGLGYALLLYFRNKKSSLSPKVRIVLGVLRFLSISILAFLLLSPLVKQQLTNKEKPIIIVGQDNSSSIMLNSDSLFYKNNYIPLLQQTIAELEKDYEYLTEGGVFPEHLIKKFIATKRAECSEMSKIPTPAEFERYYNL